MIELEELRLRIAAAGINQTELARRVGCTPAHLSRVLNGHVNPSLALLIALAHTLAVATAERTAPTSTP